MMPSLRPNLPPARGIAVDVVTRFEFDDDARCSRFPVGTLLQLMIETVGRARLAV
jgi:hypothetical protein